MTLAPTEAWIDAPMHARTHTRIDDPRHAPRNAPTNASTNAPAPSTPQALPHAMQGPLHLTDRPVLVTGAAGFVASHLCDRLIERGLHVLGLDNLSTGHPTHLAHLRGHPRFTFIEHDITRPLPAAVHAAGHIFNLACPASPTHYQRHPVATVLASTVGVWRLLELARRAGARLLQVSTSEVYGDPQVHPQHESYWGHVNPTGQRSCYDEGKRSAEAMCYAYERQHGVAVRMARLFNCYGPRLRPGDGRVVSNFIVQALAGRPLTVYGDGQQTRSFCFVSDTVRGLLALMDAPDSQPVNIGNPHEHTVLELAERVLRLTDSRSTLTHRKLPADDPVRRRPDIGAAHRLLGWRPEVTLDEGLNRTIAHFRKGGTVHYGPPVQPGLPQSAPAPVVPMPMPVSAYKPVPKPTPMPTLHGTLAGPVWHAHAALQAGGEAR